MFRLFTFLSLLMTTLCLIFAKITTTEATMCAPLSRFKIDCNTCYCSVDGSRYTCTKRFCNSEIALNFNDFVNDAPYNQHLEQQQDPSSSDEGVEDWDQFLNDLAVNYDDNDKTKEEWLPLFSALEPENNENHLDYGDYLKGDTEYIGSRKGARRL